MNCRIERRPTPLCIVAMMERLGIEPGRGVLPRESLRYAVAFRRCEACKAKQACREWLDGCGRPALLAPPFCPNAGILFELCCN
jgi:hypothetical protein